MGFMGGMAAGLLGAGLIGLMLGGGFFSGLGSLAGVLGFLLQVALIGGLVWLALAFFRRQRQPATAGAPQGLAREAMRPAGPAVSVPPIGGGMGAHAAAPAPMAPAAQPVEAEPIAVEGADYGVFEQRLSGILEAFGRGDRATIAQLATPEMANHMLADLDDLGRRGLANPISDVKLLQGDLSEAWREDDYEYATVAMRFALIEAKIDKATGRVVEGDRARPQEATEIWTFVRGRGEDSSGWLLSAIQPAA
jgi:predicted lipid-binding transport protein (Tim44 family)